MTIRDTQNAAHDSGKMRSTIRSATLSGYAELARSVGLDPHRLMRKCGLDPSCLSDPDTRIDATAVAKLLEISRGKPGRRLRVATFHGAPPRRTWVRSAWSCERKPLHGAPSKRSAAICSCTANCSPSDRGCGRPRDPSGGHCSGCPDASAAGIELFVGYLFRILQELLARHGSRGAFCSCTRAREPDPDMSPCSGASSTLTLISTVSSAGRRTWPGRFHPQIRSCRDMRASIWMQ